MPNKKQSDFKLDSDQVVFVLQTNLHNSELSDKEFRELVGSLIPVTSCRYSREFNSPDIDKDSARLCLPTNS